jgi:pimeloyl-ACP methyl ester carboxylesterase
MTTTSEPTTVFLHGYTGDHKGLQALAESMGRQPQYLCDMPGFGKSADPPKGAQASVAAYAEHFMTTLRHDVPHGKLRLVGHSHGAMVAFAIAALYPDDIIDVVLICPVAKPRLPTRMAARMAVLSAKLLGDRRVTTLLTQPWLVSFTTSYMSKGVRSQADKDRIRAVRSQEAKAYRPVMCTMGAQADSFTKEFVDARLEMPVVLCVAGHDVVAGKHDTQWYQQRLAKSITRNVPSGHLGVLIAAPEIARTVLFAQSSAEYAELR